VTSEHGVNASCGPNDGKPLDGRAPALGTETPPSRPGPVGSFKLRSQLFPRRDRWGRINPIESWWVVCQLDASQALSIL
jgi:hypothetical protein